ncbi:MAG: class I SAM-dependent methyltransferase [Roseobacter sp.]
MSLKALLKTRIAQQGPLTVAEYMAECLLHPTYGYYATANPFGQQGDFVTAPEISQMFGELLGLCLAQSWLDRGRPAPFTLAELGPGRGTMMRDILRATQGVPGFLDSAEIWLVEASDKLRAVQRETLARYSVRHVSDVYSLPPQPLFFVANEFFDALPVRQFVRGEHFWRERQVGLVDDSLGFGLGPETPQPSLAGRLSDTDPGDLIEYAPAAAPIMHALGRLVADQGGAGLVIDYGDWRSLGDTLQAVKAHQKTNPLISPGKADLTAHVDFEALAAACPCPVSRLCPQGVFLERLGITARAEALAKSLEKDTLKSHIAAHRRLTHPDEMGNLFKVLGVFADNARPLPGLDV